MTKNHDKKHIVQIFIEQEAVKKGEFKLASGKISDLYIDTRLVTMCKSLGMVCAAMSAMLRDNMPIDKKEFSVGAVPIGGIPILSGMLTQGDILKGFFWRDDKKDHGTQKCYEGHIGNKIALIDDVATSGGSLLKTIDGLKEFDPHIEILGALVVVDRLEGAKEALVTRGIQLHSLLTREDFDNL